MLPLIGSVAGIDVGFSKTRRSSAICRVTWTRTSIHWERTRYCARDAERRSAYRQIVDGHTLQAVAIDGPLRSGFDAIENYRCAERMLTRGFCSIGKPGQSNSLVGKRLNCEANACAKTIIDLAEIEASKHEKSIDQQCVVEAFPSSFLGLMLRNPEGVSCRRNNRSDVFFKVLVNDGTLSCLVARLLPGRAIEKPFGEIRNHDDRAAFVCAVTALAVAANDYCAVGDEDGWILLPPPKFIQPWAWRQLEANAQDEIIVALFSNT